MPEWIGFMLAAAPGLIAAGGLFVKVQRLEADVKACVPQAVFEVHLAAMKDTLAEIKMMLSARTFRVSDSESGKWRASPRGVASDDE
jgi:hypothetical protein